MPRFDSGSLVGRLLDADRGGFFRIGPADPKATSSRRYVDETLVLETTFESGGDEARLIDCFTVRKGGAEHPHGQLVRIIEGIRGRMDLRMETTNTFNHPNFSGLNTSINSLTFGRVQGAQGMRSVDLQLRFNF